MKLTFLGTAAGEGYPGYWCKCPHCTYARKHGGKNIRTNSCMAVNENLLIDIGPSCFDNAARFGIDLTQVKTLLITHPHEDHLYPVNLFWRYGDEKILKQGYAAALSHVSPRFTEIPELHVYGNRFTVELLNQALKPDASRNMILHEIQEGIGFEADGYQIMPVRGNHGSVGYSHSYVVQNEGRTFLYALDTGDFAEDQFELVARYQYDAIIMEGTFGLNELHGTHMCLVDNIKMRDKLEKRGCLKPGCRFILTHMSPHWCPPHDWYESIVEAERMELSYDGRQVEI